MKIKNQDFLKRENQSLVLELILEKGPLSRAEIAKQTSMSPTSASRIVTSLLEMNLIKEIDKSSVGVGRKAIYLVPNENSIVSVGVEIDLNQIRIAFIDFVGDITVDKVYRCETKSPEEVVDFISKAIKDLIESEALNEERIIGVCVGIPGLIQHEEGIVKLSAQFHWEDIPLKDLMESRLGYEVHVENELKLKALAEYEDNSEFETMAILGFGSGVGSAVIGDGEVYRGEGNYSGEIGHTTLDPYGTYCPCGSFGCLQTYIAVDFLINEASKTKKVTSIEEIVTEYRQGQRWAINILEKASTYAAIAINNVVCTYNPEVVILSGSLIEEQPEIRELIVEKSRENVWPPLKDTFDLEFTKLKDKGVVMGAALHLQRNFIKNI